MQTVGFAGAQFKKFETKAEAEDFVTASKLPSKGGAAKAAASEASKRKSKRSKDSEDDDDEEEEEPVKPKKTSASKKNKTDEDVESDAAKGDAGKLIF